MRIGSAIGPFDIEVTVRTYELDVLGHTNNAVYLNWAEQARLSAFGALGFGLDSVLAGDVMYVIARAEVDFRHPTHLGERLVIATRLEGVGTSSIRLWQPVVRCDDGELVCGVRAVIVWLGEDGRPARLPDDVRARLGRLPVVEGGTATVSGGAIPGEPGGAQAVETTQGNDS
ncbi:MAG: thioesterase family protein [Gemmatimonadota bacterium]|nr:thioesterase family protein [Gemmatimonadota bacterium]